MIFRFTKRHTSTKGTGQHPGRLSTLFPDRQGSRKNVLSKLREDYNKTLRHSLPGTDYVRYIERTLKALYEDGIIAGNDLKRMEEDSIIAIRLVDKNVATSRFIDQLYTVKEAYEYLLNADTTHYKRRYYNNVI